MSRYKDEEGYQYRKKLPIYENSSKVMIVRYVCLKCEMLIHYNSKENFFYKTSKAKHQCKLTNHEFKLMATSLNNEYLKQVEQIFAKVLNFCNIYLMHYIFFLESIIDSSRNLFTNF